MSVFYWSTNPQAWCVLLPSQLRPSSSRIGRARERIIRRLLEPPASGRWTAYSLSKAARCSDTYAHNYLLRLQEEGLLHGARVANYSRLFEYWLAIAERPRKVDFFVGDPQGFFRPATARMYALTTYAGEALRHGYLNVARYDLYILERDEEFWRTRAEGRGGVRGAGNLRFLVGDPDVGRTARPEARAERLFDAPRALPVVGDPQLVLDLYREGGAAVEAADRIVEKRGWTTRTRTRKRK